MPPEMNWPAAPVICSVSSATLALRKAGTSRYRPSFMLSSDARKYRVRTRTIVVPETPLIRPEPSVNTPLPRARRCDGSDSQACSWPITPR